MCKVKEKGRGKENFPLDPLKRKGEGKRRKKKEKNKGCYIGKAEFKGEDMKMYPFFGTAATPSVQAAVE